MFLFPTETEGFKIDSMGRYHGLSLESAKVVCNKITVLLYVKSTGQLNATKKNILRNLLRVCPTLLH